MKTVEELLIPRFKVIAPWFDMLERFEVGVVFEHPYGRQYFTQEGKGDPNDYPHLFKKLEWQEERELSDMPKYVKYVSNGKVYEAIEYLERNTLVLIMNDYWKIPIKNQLGEPFWMPATEQEYNDYQKTNS